MKMEMEQCLNLLHSLSSSALNIWGFLITVSLGIVAFLGSVRSIPLPLAFVLCVLYVSFSISNHKALERNYDQRVVITSVMKRLADLDSEFKKETTQSRRIIEAFKVDKDRKNVALSFQITASALVAILIVGWPLLQISLTRRSSKDAQKSRGS